MLGLILASIVGERVVQMVEISFKLNEIGNDNVLDNDGEIVDILYLGDYRNHLIDDTVHIFHGLATSDQEFAGLVNRDVTIIRLQSITQPVTGAIRIVDATIELGGYERQVE